MGSMSSGGGGVYNPPAPAPVAAAPVKPKRVMLTGPQLSPEQEAARNPKPLAPPPPPPDETDEERRQRMARASLILGADFGTMGGSDNGNSGGAADAGGGDSAGSADGSAY